MALIHGMTHDGELKPLKIDDWGWSQVSMSYVHHKIHDGESFQVWYWEEDIADDGVIEILLRTSSDPAHAIYDVGAGGDAVASLIENPTVNAAGTALTEYNLNRTSTATANTTTFHTPTVAAGTELVAQYLAGGAGPQAGGGQAQSDSEWVLKPNEDYVVRVTNISGQAQTLGLLVEWYEQARH